MTTTTARIEDLKKRVGELERAVEHVQTEAFRTEWERKQQEAHDQGMMSIAPDPEACLHYYGEELKAAKHELTKLLKKGTKSHG